MKILLVRISSLGDVILTTHLPRLIKKKFPDAQLDYLVSKQYSQLLRYNPYISKVLEYDKSLPFTKHLLSMFSWFNQINYDYIIDLQNNPRSLIFTFGKSTAIYRFPKHRLTKLLMIYFKYRPNLIKSIPELYKDSIPFLRDFDDNYGLEIWTKKDFESGYYFPHTRSISPIALKKIAIAPGAKHFTKRLPVSIFKQLIENLLQEFECKIILLGGREDIDLAKELVIDTKLIENFVGEIDFISTAEILDDVELVVTNDSAVVHFASSRKIPVVQIFGSTVPEFGFTPYKVPFQIVELNDVKCRPCTHYGRLKCPRHHFNCMNKITPQKIFDAIMKLKSELQTM